MCTLQESELALKTEEVDEDDVGSRAVSSDLCKKCRTVQHVLTLRKKDSYCEACFISNCLHKFRSTLGKNKAIARHERVLVVFDGGPSSTALLHLLNSGFEDPSSKKVVYTPVFLILKRSLDPEESLEDVIHHAARYSFETKVVNIETSSLDSETLTFDSAGNKGIEKGLFEGAKDAGARLYLFQRYWYKVMIAAADKLNCSKIMTGESATDCAVSLLSGIAMGRGMNVAQDVAFAEVVTDKLKILRPMREFSTQEIDFYNSFNGLNPPLRGFSKFGGVTGDSIQRLSEKFAVGLQDDYPATIPTIFRTGDKLSAENDLAESRHCMLCRGTLDTSLDKPCSLQATRFSELLSQKGAKFVDENNFLNMLKDSANSCSSNEGGCCGEGDGECKTFKLDKEDIQRELCYSCRINFTQDYPDVLLFEAKRKVARDKMKEDIKDFLL